MDYEGLYDVNYKIINNKNVIYLFIRNKDGTKTIKTVTDFKPYIYINPEDVKIINSDNLLKQKCTGVSDKKYITIFGEEVRKLFLKKPTDAYAFRTALSKTYESDILFSLRYCIDEIGKLEPTKYKTLYFDIETDIEQGFPDSRNPINPIICLSAKDNYSQKITTFAWRKDQKKRVEGDTYYFDNEVDMLNSFIKYWKEQDYDIITAWNLNFDVGYLIVRAKKLNIKIDDLGEVKVFQDEENIQINKIEIFGKVLFDLLTAYKRMHAGELKSYALNNISQDELGEKKEKVYNTGDVWREDLTKLISYNRKDVDLIYKIDEKCKLISIFDNIRRFAGVRNILDCFSASRIHETRIMKSFRDVIFPNKPPFKEKSEDTVISGVLLKEPNPGLYSNVICIDAKSLYPSIIYTFNLSAEMIDEKGVLLNKIKVKQQPKGIMAKMIKELIQLKDNMKKEVAGTGQSISDKMNAIKGFINSFYGVNALTSFRLYNKDIAENIVRLGAEITKKCSELVEKKYGYKVIYNDTDSLFVEITDKVDLVKKGEEIEEFLDKEINDYCIKKYGVIDSTLHMEFEKVYETLILQAKRRYAGKLIWEDDKVVNHTLIKGMAARRGDTPNISKIMQQELFDMILSNKSKEEVTNYLDNLIKDIMSGKILREDISQPVKLNTNAKEYKTNLPKIRGVRWSNDNIGTSFSAGNKFKLIYVKHPGTDVVCFEEDDQIKKFEIDWDKQLDKCVFQKIKPILEILGWNDIYKNLKNNFQLEIKGQKTLRLY